jgi:probable HAF family extracellular repeat protein
VHRVLGAIATLCFVGSIGVTAEQHVLFMELPPAALPHDIGSSAIDIVGTFFSGGAFYWMPTTGERRIGGRSAVAMSRDGLTVVGNALDAHALENAAIWNGGTEWRVLGSFTPDSRPCDVLLSGAFGASDDGQVVVGLGWNGCRHAHAFRWERATGMVDLGSLNANPTRANNVSGDGKVVVGWQEETTGFRQGAKWIDRREELIRGPNGAVGEAFDANRDGSLVVGQDCGTGGGTTSAWKWTAAEGVVCFPVKRPATLPNLRYQAAMLATSEDGATIGGAFTFGLNSESLIWLDGQAHFLKEYLRSHGYPDAFQGWVNTGFVTSVSLDGRTLVGYGAGPSTFQGFIVVLPAREPKHF